MGGLVGSDCIHTTTAQMLTEMMITNGLLAKSNSKQRLWGSPACLLGTLGPTVTKAGAESYMNKLSQYDVDASSEFAEFVDNCGGARMGPTLDQTTSDDAALLSLLDVTLNPKEICESQAQHDDALIEMLIAPE